MSECNVHRIRSDINSSACVTGPTTCYCHAESAGTSLCFPLAVRQPAPIGTGLAITFEVHDDPVMSRAIDVKKHTPDLLGDSCAAGARCSILGASQHSSPLALCTFANIGDTCAITAAA